MFVPFFACPENRNKERVANHLVPLKNDYPALLGCMKWLCQEKYFFDFS